jgi:hypothetical protein
MTIHHYVVAYDSTTNRWFWEGDLEGDLFSKIGGTILDTETGRFRTSGEVAESTDPADVALDDIEDKAVRVLTEALKLMNYIGVGE